MGCDITKSIEDKKGIIHRSILEESGVWHSSHTEENGLDLKRVQKAAISLFLGEKYKNRELPRVNCESLKERRENCARPSQSNV